MRGGGGGTKSEEPSELSEEDPQKIMALVTEQEDALQPGASRFHAAAGCKQMSHCSNEVPACKAFARRYSALHLLIHSVPTTGCGSEWYTRYTPDNIE